MSPKFWIIQNVLYRFFEKFQTRSFNRTSKLNRMVRVLCFQRKKKCQKCRQIAPLCNRSSTFCCHVIRSVMYSSSPFSLMTISFPPSPRCLKARITIMPYVSIGPVHVFCHNYVIRWFATLTKFWSLKYKFLFYFYFFF